MLAALGIHELAAADDHFLLQAPDRASDVPRPRALALLLLEGQPSSLAHAPPRRPPAGPAAARHDRARPLRRRRFLPRAQTGLERRGGGVRGGLGPRPPRDRARGRRAPVRPAAVLDHRPHVGLPARRMGAPRRRRRLPVGARRQPGAGAGPRALAGPVRRVRDGRGRGAGRGGSGGLGPRGRRLGGRQRSARRPRGRPARPARAGDLPRRGRPAPPRPGGGGLDSRAPPRGPRAAGGRCRRRACPPRRPMRAGSWGDSWSQGSWARPGGRARAASPPSCTREGGGRLRSGGHRRRRAPARR